MSIHRLAFLALSFLVVPLFAVAHAAQGEVAPAVEVFEIFHPDGAKHERFLAYLDAAGTPVRHGEYESWHPNGKRNARGEYVHGRRERRWRTWQSNGEKAAVGSYRAGWRHGKWEYFAEDGALDPVHSGVYEHKRLEPGPGRLRAEGDLKDGHRHDELHVLDVGGSRIAVGRQRNRRTGLPQISSTRLRNPHRQ